MQLFVLVTIVVMIVFIIAFRRGVEAHVSIAESLKKIAEKE